MVGDICDGINGVISLARGDISGALISFVAMVPFIGDSVKGLKYMDKASDLLKLGDKIVDIGKSTAKVCEKKLVKLAKKETLEIISKGEKEFKKVLEATLDLGKSDYVVWIKDKGEFILNKVNNKLPESIQLCLKNGCLVGDTLVKTKDGLKFIKEIKVGDLVLSKNEETGLTEYKKVTEIHKNSTYESCIIKTENSIIEGTTGHLFMIKDKWWTPALDIKENDYIELSNGSYEKIIEIEYKSREYPINTYNLTVEDNHNYYTGKNEVLTHNMGRKINCKLAEDISKPIGRLNMSGKTHPVSGVKFDIDGFPIFKSEYNINLDSVDYLKSRGTHFNRASKSLYSEIQNNAELTSKFTQKEIEILKEGGVPKRFTWHHNQEPGLMQLVDRIAHRKTGHDGGFSIW
ncbi:HNH endonuclease [Paraclostridium ghonii]|uniref:HNH endonuclease n=1 Tax=Paraclostridium ghonii TaxID=29358 RepID=UPI0035268118